MILYVATQQHCNLPDSSIYMPIQVGAVGKPDIGFLRDDLGKNISSKNPNYCELTAQYWIWKNSQSNIVGLCHYRRFFFKNPLSVSLDNTLTESLIQKKLSMNDAVLPTPLIFNQTIGEHFAQFHGNATLEVCAEVINEVSPEYMSAFSTVMKGHRLYAYNMLITRKGLYSEYSEWLFTILKTFENRINLENLSHYEQRMMGFVGERLLNVWVEKNKLSTTETPTFITSEKTPLIRQIRWTTHRVLNKITHLHEQY